MPIGIPTAKTIRTGMIISICSMYRIILMSLKKCSVFSNYSFCQFHFLQTGQTQNAIPNAEIPSQLIFLSTLQYRINTT